ncbi:hypothetical protein CABS01_02880 [Colletotrichum abscissum]|uniref:uncharacterized protein n=1 Tax=Colletotrichum abscissum TaxID=1671311 RepID=UPI0027D5AD30|nr:uncharacterized protein CABS01_02880 [Colletotrichum abscissum]KAK1483144.1 hypothetical protein CABS01_02880 [Colletotrichum abscissum]
MHTIVLMLSAHFHITRPARSGGQLGPELDHGAVPWDWERRPYLVRSKGPCSPARQHFQTVGNRFWTPKAAQMAVLGLSRWCSWVRSMIDPRGLSVEPPCPLLD